MSTFDKRVTMTPEQAAELARREEAEVLGDWEPKNFSDILTVDSQHIMVISDVHYPKHDRAMLEQVIDQAIEEGIDTVILAGDYFDMEEYSKYGIDDHTSNFQRNLRGGAVHIRRLIRMGIKVVWSQGNHEARVFRGQHQLDMKALALIAGLGEYLDNGMLIVSDNPTVYASVGNWMITHPAQYGSFPLVVASKLATRYQANTIVAHEHHWGQTLDETGQFIAINSGGLFDPNLHKYIQHSPTSHRAWTRGFVTLHKGHPSLYRGLPTSVVQRKESEIVDAI